MRIHESIQLFKDLLLHYYQDSTISCHLVSYRLVLFYVISYCITLYSIILLYHIVSYLVVLYRVLSYRVLSYRIVSYHIVSHHIGLDLIIEPHLQTPTSIPNPFYKAFTIVMVQRISVSVLRNLCYLKLGQLTGYGFLSPVCYGARKKLHIQIEIQI